MVTKNDFSPADWTTLRDTQYLVGFATLLAGSSGIGTIKELAALSRGIIENQASDVPLIRDLTGMTEMQAAQNSLKQSLSQQQNKPNPDAIRRLALERALATTTILAKASKEEKDAYNKLLYKIAEKVANAAREGGILGFGGTQVSEGERSFLNDLRSTLQLEEVKHA